MKICTLTALRQPRPSMTFLYHINGDNFERSYKETISGFKIWKDADHAEDWVIIPKNMGTHLSIDETCLSTGEVYTILSKAFNDIAAAMYDREDEILNYFVNRSTNASAESLNAKIKDFRAQLRGVIDKKFFIFRLIKIFG